MNIILSLVLLFIIINSVINSGEAQAQCTPEQIRMCCSQKCMDPYCDSVTGSCECGNVQLSKDQCSAAVEKCPSITTYRCCNRRCKYPHCNPKTGRCGCGDNKLTTSQCAARG